MAHQNDEASYVLHYVNIGVELIQLMVSSATVDFSNTYLAEQITQYL